MANLKVNMYVVGPVQTNCYIARNTETDEIIIIDPGSAGRQLAEIINKEGYVPKGILLTHGHFDHTDGIADLASNISADIPVYALDEEKKTLDDPNINLSASMGYGAKKYSADIYLRDGEEIELAGFRIKVIHTPGHTEGGCCYYIADQSALFVGDTLFAGSVGRTDFPEGSMSKLIRSIKDKLLILPDDTRVYPGHDSITTIADEKKYNPFL